jgi:hypothetical protein
MGGQIDSSAYHHANIESYTRLVAVSNPNITDELSRMHEKE